MKYVIALIALISIHLSIGAMEPAPTSVPAQIWQPISLTDQAARAIQRTAPREAIVNAPIPEEIRECILHFPPPATKPGALILEAQNLVKTKTIRELKTLPTSKKLKYEIARQYYLQTKQSDLYPEFDQNQFSNQFSFSLKELMDHNLLRPGVVEKNSYGGREHVEIQLSKYSLNSLEGIDTLLRRHNVSLNTINKIHLDFNDLQTIDPYLQWLLDNSAQLKELTLNFNQLTQAPDLRHNPQLKELTLSSNRLTQAPDLSHNPQLKVLDLSSNRLTQAPDLSNNPQLRYLNLFETRLTQAPYLSHNPALLLLNLQYNRLTQAPDLSNNPALLQLNLQYNRLTQAPDLSNNPQLEVLDFSNNPLPASEVDKLPERFKLEALRGIREYWEQKEKWAEQKIKRLARKQKKAAQKTKGKAKKETRDK